MKNNDYDMWCEEWGGQLYYCPGTVHSNGLIILFKKGLDIQNVTQNAHSNRILEVSFQLHDKMYSILNNHAPNLDAEKKTFLDEVKFCITFLLAANKIIVAGDFNTVLNSDLGIVAGYRHDMHVVKKFNDTVNECNVFDVWRLFHGDDKDFTWSNSSNPWVARRLDYVLLDKELVEKTLNCDIVTIGKSDHRGIVIELELEDVKRGPSYWKFNQSMLKDPDYIQHINNKIELLKVALENFPPQLKWDYCKAQIKDATISYSKQEAVNKKNELSSL